MISQNYNSLFLSEYRSSSDIKELQIVNFSQIWNNSQYILIWLFISHDYAYLFTYFSHFIASFMLDYKKYLRNILSRHENTYQWNITLWQLKLHRFKEKKAYSPLDRVLDVPFGYIEDIFYLAC